MNKGKDNKIQNPKHDCPALGKGVMLPRAFNDTYPDKIFFMCPICGYRVEELKPVIREE